MKKIVGIILFLMVGFSLGLGFGYAKNKDLIHLNDIFYKKQEDEKLKSKKEKDEDKPIIINNKNNLVSYNGNIKIKDNTLVNQYDEKIQLKGMSSHGLQWYKDLATFENMKILKEEWHSNLFRIAMYTDEGGYISNKSLKNDVEKIVENAIKLDMYVIIDWHILNDNDPLMYLAESKEFFSYMSKKYKNTPNVIFEICNEPNGNVTWDKNIKPYADQIIKEIRKNSNNIIIVGTGTYSQDVDKVINNKIDDNNTMYALHFYSGTHKEDLRNRVDTVINKIPIFASEWGVSDASGNGGVYIDESKKWIEYLKKNNISWANWSLSNKNESSALLKENKTTISLENLSESGIYVKQAISEE